jgi:membrane-bound inhibitor of C-type lysozyme
VRAALQTCPVLFAVLLLACSGCATAPTGSSPAQNTAPRVSFPSSTRVLEQATVYISEAGEKLEVVHDNMTGNVIVKLPDGAMALLHAELAGSEGRYRDSRMTVWEQDGSVLFWVDGKLVFGGRRVK